MMPETTIAITGMGLYCGPFSNVQALKSIFCPPVAWEDQKNNLLLGHNLMQEVMDQAFRDAGLDKESDAQLRIGLFTAGTHSSKVPLDWLQDQVVHDQAFSSSLDAVAQGVNFLQAKACDLAVVLGFSSAEKTADAEACASCVILQPLAAADPQRIWSVLRDVHTSDQDSPDRKKLSYFAQAAGIIDLQTISLVLTNIGNHNQFNPDLDVFPPRGELEQRFVYDLAETAPQLASLDLNGILIISLALEYWLVPVNAPDHVHDAGQKCCFLQTASSQPWFRGGVSTPRRAGISTPKGGAVLEEYLKDPIHSYFVRPGQAGTVQRWTRPTELFVLSGPTKDDLLDRIDSLVSRIQDLTGSQAVNGIQDGQASTLALEMADSKQHSHRLALVVTSFSDLLNKLSKARDKISASSKKSLRITNQVKYGQIKQQTDQGKTVFLFPGQGSQYPNMLADLYAHFPDFKQWIEAYDHIGMHIGKTKLPALSYPPPHGLSSKEREMTQEAIQKADVGGLGTILSSQALYNLLQDIGIQADAMLGHSNGENTALVASGTMDLDLEGVIKAILQIQQISQDADQDETVKGQTIAVSITNRETFHHLLQEYKSNVFWTMDNCPHQAVVFGKHDILSQLNAKLSKAGGICTKLPFDIGFHTSLMQKYQIRLRTYYETEKFTLGHTPLYSSITCEQYPTDPQAMRDLAAKHWTHQVKFRETIESLYQKGFRNFIEVGPNNLLTSFVDDILRGKPHVAIASNVKKTSGLLQIQHLVAECYVRGLPLALNKLLAPHKAYSRPKSPIPEPTTKAYQELDQRDLPFSGTEPSRTDRAVRAAIAHKHFELMNDFLQSQSRIFTALFSQSKDTPAPSQSRV
ncbi:MAG: acyltransferase domain-containing protein, partial [Desulfonatronovibrio sp.]